ncbi:MAG: hypothetical protein EBY32_05755 [Proteobacteria bacterium]|nr:hypothetical protein [Pseudomonadota bacterium]
MFNRRNCLCVWIRQG